MKRNSDTIQFEYRSEIRSIMSALEETLKKDPENQDIKRLYDLLDIMDMEWQKSGLKKPT